LKWTTEAIHWPGRRKKRDRCAGVLIQRGKITRKQAYQEKSYFLWADSVSLSGVIYRGILVYMSYIKFKGMGNFTALKFREIEGAIEIIGLATEEHCLHRISVDEKSAALRF